MTLWNPNVSAPRHAAAAVCAALLYLALDVATGAFEFWPGTAQLFFPAAVAVALLVGLGLGHALTVLLTTLLATVWPDPSALPFGVRIAWAFIVTAGYSGLAWALRSHDRFEPSIRRLSDAGRLVAAVLAASLVVSVAVNGLRAAAGALNGDLVRTVLGFWIGDAAGILSLTPFLLVVVLPLLEGRDVQRMPRTASHGELMLQGITVAVCVALLFMTIHANGPLPLYLLLLPPIWIVTRTGLPAGVSAHAVLTAAAAAAMAGSGAPEETTVLVATALIAISVVGLMLGGLMEERATARNDLEERHRHLERAEQVASMGSWVWDLRGGFCRWSDELYRIHGLDPGETDIDSRTYLDYVAPADRERVSERVQAAVERGSGFHLVYRIHDARGRDRIVASWGEVQRDEEGRPVRLTGTCRDVTEERLREEEAFRSRRLEAMGRMLAAIAHDFNNYLSVVEGRATLIQEAEAGGESAEDAAEIREAADRAKTLTAQLLAFARGEEFNPEAVDLTAELQSHEWMFQRLVGTHVRLLLDLAPDLPTVAVERGRLERVMSNLVTNAREATSGQGEVIVRTRAVNAPSGEAEEDTWVALEVVDNGIGMSPDVVDRIFDPFFTTRRDAGGTGLGLATVYRIVRQFGGRIQVDSAVGAGTTFRILLPPATDADGRDRDPGSGWQAARLQ